jgi:hypothetical protein
MGCFTIYCPISGLPLNFSYDKGNENDVKYDHLNNANVVLPDGTITEIGYHDSYGRIETDDEIFSCNEEYTEYRYGIAISNSVYKLLLLHPKFIDFINKKKNLYDYINNKKKNLNDYIKNNTPFKEYYGAQCACLENIKPKDIPYYVDPFLEEKIEEPLLGRTLIRGTRKINGNKNKIHLTELIDKYLDFIPETNDVKLSDEQIDFEKLNIK